MEMMFLIVKLSYGSVVMPQTYSKEQCEKIADSLNKSYVKEGYCIPAPIFKYSTDNNCRQEGSLLFCPAGSSLPYPGYFCGQNNCTLNNGAK